MDDSRTLSDWLLVAASRGLVHVCFGRIDLRASLPSRLLGSSSFVCDFDSSVGLLFGASA